MNIDKAIVHLDYLRFLNKRKKDTETFEALKLGIEALKLAKANRKTKLMVDIGPLPGETKD